MSFRKRIAVISGNSQTFGISRKLIRMEVSYSAIPEKQVNEDESIDPNIILVVPGEVITTESGFLK